MIRSKVLLVLVSVALLAGCSKNKAVDAPAKLVDFQSKIKVQKAWSAGVGGDKPKLRLGLGVTVDGDRAFTAGHGGDVLAVDVRTGKKLWSTDTKLALAGGPGAGG